MTTQLTSLDGLTADLTAFNTFDAMLNAAGNYRPTILPRDERHIVLADAYDAAQLRRGDKRRAFRGHSFTQRVPLLSVRLSSLCDHGKPSNQCCGYPEWLKVVHAINKQQPETIGSPIASYDWWSGGWAEEYPEFRILLKANGDSNYVVAKTPEAAALLKAAVLDVTGHEVAS